MSNECGTGSSPGQLNGLIMNSNLTLQNSPRCVTVTIVSNADVKGEYYL